MNKLLVLGAMGFSLIATSMAHASCDDLTIVITNTTTNGCSLTQQNLKHGYFPYYYFAPTYIKASEAVATLVAQNFYGPELELTYSCGEGKSITINSQQNWSFLSAGDVHGQIVNATSMSADFQVVNGSCFNSQPGQLLWKLK